ncbi:hypothetical protein DRQ18_04895 [bacterium]|nr:MAG: hypothetical protein DRQ18_04895 [bacterium]
MREMSEVRFYSGGKGDEYPRMIKVGESWIYVEVLSSSLFENGEREWLLKGEDGNLYRVRGKEEEWRVERVKKDKPP